MDDHNPSEQIVETFKPEGIKDYLSDVTKTETQETRSLGERWWNSKFVIALITLILPLSGVIFNYTKYLSEKDQTQRRRENEVQMQYLTLVTRTPAGLQQQRMVLRFLAATASEAKVRKWASQEITTAQNNEQQIAQDQQRLEVDFRNLVDAIKKLTSGMAATRGSSAQADNLLRLAQINRDEIDRLRKQIDNTSTIPTLPISTNRFRCLAGTVTAQGGFGSGETRNAQCQSSLAKDGSPPNGVLELSGLSYSWISKGTPCSCTVSVSVD